MKILITGGGGFIGSNLADRLLSEGHEVLTVDTYATSRRDNLTPQAGLTIVEGSIADEAFFNGVVDDFGPEAIVHAAASYKDPDAWEEDARTNALGTAIVVKAAERVGVQRFVYFQTALCYGVQARGAADHAEPSAAPVRLVSYAISKTAGEDYIRLSSLNWVSFRLANVYGPRNLSGPLPTFFSRLTQDKGCFVTDTRRDFLFVTDLVDVVVKAIDGTGSRRLPRVVGLGRVDQGAVRRDHVRAGPRRRSTSRSARARPTTPSRSCSTPRARTPTSTGRPACRCPRAWPRRSPGIASTASSRPTRTSRKRSCGSAHETLRVGAHQLSGLLEVST